MSKTTSHTPNYAELFTGQRIPTTPAMPPVMSVRSGVAYALVNVSYNELFDIKFRSRERLVDALHEHAEYTINERGGTSRNGPFIKRLTRVRFTDDGVHVLMLNDNPPLSDEPNF